MIKFKFKFNNKTITATVPSNWDEVTVKQFIAMDCATWDSLDIVEIIGVLSGVDVSRLYKTKSKPLDAVYAAMDFLKQKPPDWEKIQHQDYITIWDKTIKIPQDLELEAFGLWIEFQQLSESRDIAKICALYLQPVLYGKVDRDQRKHVEQSILDMPIIIMLPIFNFFLMMSNEFQVYGKPVLNQYPQQESKKKTNF